MTTLETVRAMWSTGKAAIDVERAAKPFDTPMYFARLEALVGDIKAHLARHELLKATACTVKHGESTVQVTVDLQGIVVIRDPQDPERPFFHIPVIPKDSNAPSL